MMAVYASWTGLVSRPIPRILRRCDRYNERGSSGIVRRFASSSEHCQLFAHGSDRRVGKIAKLINLQLRLTTSD